MTGLPTTGKYSMKPYRCQCGAEREIGTNHWGECYSDCNVCRIESVGKTFQGRWTCLEEPPEGYALPAPWTTVSLGELLK